MVFSINKKTNKLFSHNLAMLIIRTITALVIAPIVIGVVYIFPPLYFQSLLLMITLLAGYEWTRLAQFKTPYLFMVTLLVVSVLVWYQVFRVNQLFVLYVIFISLLFWLFNLLVVSAYPKFRILHQPLIIKTISGVLLLVPFFILLNFLQKDSAELLILFILLVSSADIGGYIVGKIFGKHKFSPKISPNKTLEGILGSFFFMLLVMFVWTLLTPSFFSITHFSSVVLLVAMALLGDLYESLYKRSANLKDSGNILPGHGGVLDRIDSHTASIAIFIIFFMSFQI